MFRIDDPTAVGSLPTPEAAGTEGYFTEGNPGSGVPATLVRGSFLNMVQEELRAVVVAGGLTPSKTTYDQLLNAIKAVAIGQFVHSLGSLGTPGYVKLPDGVIIQWGNVVTSPGGAVAVTFPIAFPGAAAALVTGTGAAAAAVTSFDTLSSAGFNMNGWTSSTGARVAIANAWWIAIGY